MLVINSVKDLNRFANGNCDHLLKRLIDNKQMVSANIAKLVLALDKYTTH